MHQFSYLRIVLKVILVNNSFNTHTHAHFSRIKDSFMPFYEENMVVNQISSETY